MSSTMPETMAAAPMAMEQAPAPAVTSESAPPPASGPPAYMDAPPAAAPMAAPPAAASRPMPPPAAQAPAQAASSGPGMLASMAATAGSVAAGSVVGHGISSMLFGGRSEAAAPEAAAPAQSMQQQAGPACSFQLQGKHRAVAGA